MSYAVRSQPLKLLAEKSVKSVSGLMSHDGDLVASLTRGR